MSRKREGKRQEGRCRGRQRSAAASLVAEASGYAELKDEEDAVVVDMPDKKIDVNPSASQPTVEKVYSPVTYP